MKHKLVRIAGRAGLIVLLFAFLLGAIPKQNTNNPSAGNEKSSASHNASSAPKSYTQELTFLVLNHKTGSIMELSESDYVKGVVAAEMPASFEPEALKAQAVAAHTIALRRYFEEMKHPNPSLGGATLSTDPASFQAYASVEELKETYQDGFDEAWHKISAAVDEVFDTVITYEEEPILAAYHSLSGGTTEAAVSVWGTDLPYLQAADSVSDESQPNYLSEVRVSVEEAREILQKSFPDAELSSEPEEWIQIQTRTASGMVESVTVGGKETTGLPLRSLFGLKSANFEVKQEDSELVFTVKGYGHGVGMSQYGANALAQQGKSYDEILTHYYAKVALSDRAQLVAQHLEDPNIAQAETTLTVNL